MVAMVICVLLLSSVIAVTSFRQGVPLSSSIATSVDSEFSANEAVGWVSMLPPEVRARIYEDEGVVKGSGSFGEVAVFPLKNCDTEEHVAIKYTYCSRFGFQAGAPCRVTEIEAKTLKTLNNLHSSHIISYWGGVNAREFGRVFVMMEALEGKDAAAYANNNYGTDSYMSGVAMIALDALRGLAKVHEYWFIHRDIKPSNIMLAASSNGLPRAKLVDFGFACRNEKSLGPPCIDHGGTFIYLPPEVVYAKLSRQVGKSLTPAVDIWSLGMSIWHMVFNDLPFPSKVPMKEYYQHMLKFDPHRALRSARILPELKSLLESMLRKNPHARPTAIQLIEGEAMRFAEAAIGVGRVPGELSEAGTPPECWKPAPPTARPEAKTCVRTTNIGKCSTASLPSLLGCGPHGSSLQQRISHASCKRFDQDTTFCVCTAGYCFDNGRCVTKEYFRLDNQASQTESIRTNDSTMEDTLMSAFPRFPYKDDTDLS
eukprot:TRINITY_DN15421_c0_g2_i1.p1 TRINITY_DN15421_c0_g2~~TRINITY_DN15421_c0_g2_i1.p1  ORF type:complete len:484 (-),score=45.65 TRINITY_DN15421_c0_g2_i1:55-1506(-)